MAEIAVARQHRGMEANGRTSAPVRVLIVDDSSRFRVAGRCLLESLGGVEIVGEACDGATGLAAVDELRPDLALVDVMIPGFNGLVLASLVKARGWAPRLIVITSHDAQSFAAYAGPAGADAFLPKDMLHDRLPALLSEWFPGRTGVSSRGATDDGH